MPQFLIGTNVPWMRRRRYAYLFSGLATLVGILSIVTHGGLRFGIDFSGGRLIHIMTDRPVAVEMVRQVTDQIGYSGAEIQEIGEGGTQFQIRVPHAADVERQKGVTSPSEVIAGRLEEAHPGLGVEVRREETVGPKVGQELRGKAVWAILWSLVGILAYVGIRYEFKFALGAVVAIFHDIFFTITVLSLMNKEFTIPVIAALLTIAGYSVNDTIVVFDRIREKRPQLRREPLESVMDLAVNQTLSRTIITVATALFTVYALFFLGGEVIHDFAFAMLVGVFVGAYSSVYVASALALDITRWFEKGKESAQATA